VAVTYSKRPLLQFQGESHPYGGGSLGVGLNGARVDRYAKGKQMRRRDSSGVGEQQMRKRSGFKELPIPSAA